MSVTIPAGNTIDDFNVIIEIPAHAGEIKYEYHKDFGLIGVDRFMTTSMRYPCNYGFVPSTLSEDGDPIDVLVETPHPVQPGALMRVRAVALLKMRDEAGHDSKLLAFPIPKTCKEYNHIQSLNDVPQNLLHKLIHFFARYKDLEPGKSVTVEGWEDKPMAEQEFFSGVQRFKDHHAATHIS